MIKLYSLLSTLFTAGHSSSFLSMDASKILPTIKHFMDGLSQIKGVIWKGFLNFLTIVAWSIIKFILGIMEIFEFIINEFLGIDSSVQDIADYATSMDAGGISFVTMLTKTFRAIVGVSIVLLFIFTIIAIIRQEWNNATQQQAGQGVNNDKRPIIMGLFKKMLYIILLPLTMIFIITGVNSILTAFSRAMKGSTNMTIASQVLATSTYDSNKYRYYAQQNKRIPIVIRAYDPNQYKIDENDKLQAEIKSFEVQDSLEKTANNIVAKNLLTFKDSLNYKNNKLSNSVRYDETYEKFVCTAEQYQIMADFIDYAQKTNTEFQIKSIDDELIEWKYVDSAIFNPSNASLKINYRDASDLNNDGNTNDSYVIEYSSSFEVTSPISDAMNSIKALLGIDEYAENLYKTMERDENYLNVVNWANEKVLIKLSDDFELNNPSEWSRLDQLIIYEYYRFSSNNTFGDYTIENLKEGVELDAAQICYREYYAEANAYSPERIINCVKINGSYYHVEKDPYKTDSYGNVYYVLKDVIAEGEGVGFLNNEYSTIQKIENQTARLKLKGKEGTFNINNPSTWSYSDQILVYEFYKDLTYNNTLYKYNFNDFVEGVTDVPVFTITHNGINGTSSLTSANGNYILINGTYYKAQETGTGTGIWELIDAGTEFLTTAEPYRDLFYYNYNIVLDDAAYAEKFGISTDSTSGVTANNFIYAVDTETVQSTFETLEQDDPNFNKYSSFSLALSKKFNYLDVNTWTYKDYFIFYLYANYPKIVGATGIDSLRISGVSGDIGKIDEKYVYQVKFGTYDDGKKDLYLYLDIDLIGNISSQLINNVLDTNKTKQANYISNKLFITIKNRNELIKADTETYVFEFSNSFKTSSTNPNNWTVLDYILYTLSLEGEISEVDYLKENGYSAIKYTLENDVVYGIGKYDTVNDENNKYISLNQIKKLQSASGRDLNFKNELDFLNLSILDYIAMLYDTDRSSLITNESGIIDTLYSELSPYIYSTESIISEMLKGKIFNLNANNEFELYDNVAEYVYTSTATFGNLSTWTMLDALLYSLVGYLPETFKSKVLTYNDVNYFIIYNYAVDISSDEVNGGANPFKSTLSNKNIITSRTASGYDSENDTLENFFTTNYSNLVIDEHTLLYEENTLTSTISNYDPTAATIAEYFEANYESYVFENGVDGFDATSQTKYSPAKFTYVKNPTYGYTAFDVIYEYLMGTTLAVNESVSLDVYNVGANVYAKLNNVAESKEYYIKISTESNRYISAVLGERNDLKFTQYSDSSFTYRKVEGSEYTIIDIIYEHITGSKINGGTSVSFNVYNDGSQLYLKIYDATNNVNYYVKISSVYNDDISARLNAEISLNNNAKIATTETDKYVSFDNVGKIIQSESAPKIDLEDLKFTELDALIYGKTGKTDSLEYSMYKIDEKIYIYTEKGYLLVDDTATNIVDNSTFPQINMTGDNSIDDEIVNKLYSNYYEKYIKTSISGVSSVGKDVVFEYKLGDAETLEIVDISPIALILSKAGVLNLKMEELVTVNGKIVEVTARGLKYFYFNDYIEGELKEFYIDVTNIGYIYEKDTKIYLVDAAQSTYEMALNYMLLDNGVSVKDYIDSYSNFDNIIDNKVMSYARLAKNFTTEISNVETFNLTNPDTWTMFNILYYYLSGKNNINTLANMNVYVDPTGDKYVALEYASKTVYLKIEDNGTAVANLYTKFTSTDASYELKDSNDNYTPLGIIASKKTGQDEGIIDYVSNPYGFTFYFIESAYDGSYTVIYNLTGATIRNKVTNANYKFGYQGINNITEWTTFDAVIAATRNSLIGTEIMSKIYIYGSNAYIVINDYYINITKLKILTSSEITTIFDKIGTADDINGDLIDNTSVLRNFYDSEGENYSAILHISKNDISGGAAPATETAENRINFSKDFNISDYSTWMLSDFIIYYMFTEYHDYFVRNGGVDDDFYLSTIQNFQQLVNVGYAPATEFDYIVSDEYGNTTVKKVIWVGIEKNGRNGIAIDKQLFKTFYGKKLARYEYYDVNSKVVINSPNKLTFSSGSVANAQTIKELNIAKQIVLSSNDFIYNNYYYYNIKDSILNTFKATSNSIDSIAGEKINPITSIDISIGNTFEIDKPETWTWLNLIIMYEFSNDTIRHNIFEGMAFSDLAVENKLPVFLINNELIIEINGNYYNLYKILYTKEGEDSNITNSEIESIIESKTLAEDSTKTVKDYIEVANDVSSSMKVLYSKHEYFAKKTNDYTLDYSKTADSILYTYNNSMFYYTLNTNYVDVYRINLKKLNCNDNYTVTNIVREVSWPQKLMNDMQVLYPELNWSTLIATDGWIDTLGTFTSAHASGEFNAEGNSANITAAGLVLSEFFLSVTKEVEDYTRPNVYEYEPVFDEATIKALMLAMLGEEEYNDLSMQATVFMDMFNNMFVPVLEDIAKERGVELVDGKVDNFYMSVYKAYLATILLSSDAGEYFYKVATRVYAQYTIFDSLASASGDYAAYLDYIKTNKNNDGEQVTAFRYASFHELAIYENSFSGNVNPTFTFNFVSAIKTLYGQYYSSLNGLDLSVIGVAGTDYNINDKVTSEHIKILMQNETNFKKVLDKLNKRYKETYMDQKSSIKDNNESGIYCFLYDVYWTISRDVTAKNQDIPSYVENYYDYITGNVKRWNMIKGLSIDSSSIYIPNEWLYEVQLALTDVNLPILTLALYLPNDAGNIQPEEGESFWEAAKDLLNNVQKTSYYVLEQTFRNNSNLYSDYRRAFENTLYLSNIVDAIDHDLGGGIVGLLVDSHNGNPDLKYTNKVSHQKYESVDAWTRILSIYNDLEILVKELNDVILAQPGTYVNGDKSRGFHSADINDEKYQEAYKQLLDLKKMIETHVSIQTILDIVNKNSITFTLEQFGKNYVTEGYTFSFENKSYTMKATTNTERLAEYVYGGSFLDKFGVPASYTNSEYNGFIQNYKYYDSEVGSIKTKLDIWSELRTFVAGLANYTARLYYLSNLNDLSGNVGDGIKLTDKVYQGVAGTGTPTDRTLEYMIVEYLINSDLSADTLLRLIMGDTSVLLSNMAVDVDKEIYALAYYLEGKHYVEPDAIGNVVIAVDGSNYSMSSAFKRQALQKYINFVSNDTYDSFGYYNDGTNTGVDRIHQIFKKVISYLVVTEESEEAPSEKAIKLDDIYFKDFRKILITALGDYQKNPSETDLENTNRYITLFNLICSQFAYTYYTGEKTEEAGTSVSSLYLQRTDGKMNYQERTEDGTINTYALFAEFSIDVPTRDILLTFAGVENRPIEELVGLEYDTLYDRNGNYDEAEGDTFIVTTYDESEGKFLPVVARNPKTQVSAKHFEYINKYGVDVTTNYYDTQYCYPIVAKGVIDASGYPTAIKIVDESVVFYRTDIIGTAALLDNALRNTRNGGKITTISYVKYTHSTFSGNFVQQAAMFHSTAGMDQAIKSEYKVYFMQLDQNYSVSDKDNFDSISVLDKFSAFYTLEVKQYFMFILGFTTLIPILYKSTAAVLKRILDLIFLVLMGPLAISSTAINPKQEDGKTTGTIFNSWKSYMTQTLLHVFGYIIAFNVYYILVSTVMNMELVSDTTMAMINRVGGLSSFVTKDAINAILRYVYILAAVGTIETSADLLVGIVTAGQVKQALKNPMGGDAMESIKKTVTELKNTFEKTKNIINGKILLEAKDFAIESAKKLIPGSDVIRGAIHIGQNLKTNKDAKDLQEAAIANGMSEAAAKKMAKQYAKNEKQARQTKRENRTKNANAFTKNAFGIDNQMFNAPKPPKDDSSDSSSSGGSKKKGKGKKGKGKGKGGKKKGGKKK